LCARIGVGKIPQAWFPNLNIRIYNLPRIAFEIFGMQVHWYAVFILIGAAAGIFIVTREAKNTGQEKDLYIDLFTYTFPLAVLGSRLYYVAFTWNTNNYTFFDIFNIRQGGLAIYGAVIVCVISTVVFSKIKKLNPWVLCDTAVLGLILGQAIGRWGNFVNREAFGGYTDSLFALRYLKDEVGRIPESVLQYVIEIDGVEFIQVQPTFLYESVWNFLVFAFLMFYKKYKKFDGEVLMLYFVGYGIGRTVIESLRTDQLLLPFLNLPASLVLSVLLVLFGGSFIVYKRK